MMNSVKEMKKAIDAVIVTYNPNSILLNKCIDSVIREVRYIYIVDNNSKELEYNLNDKIKLIKLNSNFGVAFAQNIGIKKSLKEDSGYILLSDQDSIYPENYIKKMVMALENIRDKDKVAVIVPLFSDPKQVKINEGFIRKSIVGVRKFYPEDGLHEIFQAIASGMILNTKLLSDIGLMREDLFIDFIDLEWCWRARKHGYKIIGNADVIITHQLGDKVINLCGKLITLRSIYRHYYITRNGLYLALRSDNINMWYRIILFGKSIKYVIGFTVLSRPHIMQFKYTMLGFWHGVIGRMGKLNGTN